MEDLYSKLHNLYDVQKTLRFELRPIGKTKENIEKEGLLTEDEYRAKIFKNVKKYCDEYHKLFIERTLNDVNLDGLEEYYNLYKIEKRDEKQDKDFTKIQSSLRKQISNAFRINKEEFNGLFSKKIIEEYLPEFYKANREKLEEIEYFKKFTTYFTGYNKNRENIYSEEEKSTAISYRLINENLPTFLSNMKIYEKVSKKIPDAINKLYIELESYIQTQGLEQIFKLDYFNDVLTQSGIELYNLVISGKSEEKAKIKGLNEYINEYNQTCQDRKDKLPKLKELYKQILSEKVSISFAFDIIEDDNDLINNINSYYKEFQTNIKSSIVCDFKQLIYSDLNKIYINNDLSVTNISNKVFKDWNYIQNALFEDYKKCYTGKAKIGTEKYDEQKKKYFKNLKVLSLGYIEKCIEAYDDSNKGKVLDYISNYLEDEDIIGSIESRYNKCRYILDKNYDENSKELLKNEKEIEYLKELLDAIKSIQEFVKLIIPKDRTIDVDEAFYGLIYEKYSILLDIIPLYNKARNYLTQKPYSTEKIKLNFNTPTFLDGWDVTKEKSNLGIILMKDGNYYLGILTNKNKKIFDDEYQTVSKENVYKKIEYKLLPGPNKMLPKVFFSASRIAEFNPAPEIMKIYETGTFKKEDNFDLDACHKLIDFYKTSIKKNRDWEKFDFKFKNTNEYKDISEFYKDIERSRI